MKIPPASFPPSFPRFSRSHSLDSNWLMKCCDNLSLQCISNVCFSLTAERQFAQIQIDKFYFAQNNQFSVRLSMDSKNIQHSRDVAMIAGARHFLLVIFLQLSSLANLNYRFQSKAKPQLRNETDAKRSSWVLWVLISLWNESKLASFHVQLT